MDLMPVEAMERSLQLFQPCWQALLFGTRPLGCITTRIFALLTPISLKVRLFHPSQATQISFIHWYGDQIGEPPPPFIPHCIRVKGFYSNKILLPGISPEALRTPTVAKWLDGVALRDLQLHQKHAACIDACGDVYQWGEGFFGDSLKGACSPRLTLRGKVRLSAFASRS